MALDNDATLHFVWSHRLHPSCTIQTVLRNAYLSAFFFYKNQRLTVFVSLKTMATETLSIFDTPLLQSMTPQLKVKVLDHALSSAMQSVTLCEEALKSAQVSAGIAIDAYFLKKMQAQLEESPEEALATKAALAKLPRPLLPTPPPRIVETNLEAQLDAVSFEVSNSSLSASTEEPMGELGFLHRM